MAFAHTPYDGSKQPFAIGIEPLGAGDWIEPDAHLVRDLALKEHLLATKRNVVVGLRNGAEAGQTEVLAKLAQHLPQRFPQFFRREGEALRILPADRAISLVDGPPLVAAARLVQEDLCLMQRDATGWRLAAAVLCFPSGWSLAEKLGRDLGAVHANVPGFAGRMENVVTRIFDNLRPHQPLVRFNWSIYGDGELHHPRGLEAPRFSDSGDAARRAHIRVERQMLTRLPASGDILFTIRIHADLIAQLAAHPRRRALALGLRAQLLALDDAQAAYKGLAEERAELAHALAAIAGA